MKMDVEGLETKINEEKAKLVILEEAYEKEVEESKYRKIEYKIDRKEEVINNLIDRQQVLLDREAENAERDAKDANAEEEDADVCLVCGGDLVEIEEGLYECEKCGELFEEDGK